MRIVYQPGGNQYLKLLNRVRVNLLNRNTDDISRVSGFGRWGRLELSKHKSDEDRLCRDCADLTRRKVEAIRLGEEYLADRIEDQMMERREGGSN